MSVVILTGFMGTGKTTIGQLLAQHLHKPFVDTDTRIEQRAGASVAEIFATKGEAYFRDLERQVVAEAVQADAVVATGGGAIVDPVNYQRMHSAAPIVCLEADPDVIVARTGSATSRPLLGTGERGARVRELLAARAEAYARADLRVDTSRRSAEVVVQDILKFLHGRGTATGAPTPHTLTVELGERAYPIIIGNGVLAEVGARVAALVPSRSAVVITNPTVSKLYLEGVAQSLQQAGMQTVVIEVPDGEEHKNLAWLALIYDRLLDAHVDRTAPILALGGGVIGDLTGFAASTYLRGVPFVQVPTTLLAQVDSSVGGKTGINHVAGKNLIGAFYQPRIVLIDIATLRTLPRRELLAGLVEVIKYGVILDADLFARIEQNLDAILALDTALLTSIIRRSCELKAMVVQRDEREDDYRSILNFGHTLGHAVESLTEYKRYLHGEAVAIGMAFAAKLSVARGYCKPETMQRIIQLLKRAGLPIEIPAEARGPQLSLAIDVDKKVAGGKVKFVCVEELGRTRFEQLTSAEITDVVTH